MSKQLNSKTITYEGLAKVIDLVAGPEAATLVLWHIALRDGFSGLDGYDPAKEE